MTANHAKRNPRDLAQLTSVMLRDDTLAVRERLVKQIDRLYGVEHKYRDEQVRLTRERIATDYLKQIHAVRKLATQDELAELRDTLISRLTKGLDLDDTPSRNALWVRLLAEYEIVEDALSENGMARLLDRVTWTESVFATA